MLSGKGEFDVASTESRTTGMVGNNPRGSWEIPEATNFSELDPSEKERFHMDLCRVRSVMAPSIFRSCLSYGKIKLIFGK